MNGRRQAAAVLLAALGAAAAARASEYAIDPARSVFAVLTHKAGIGAGLAHDHLIVATQPVVALEFDPQAPEATKFTFTVAVEALDIDAPAPRAAWKDRFKALGIHSGDLPPVGDSDRRKVRTAMLGESQLDGAKFPEIRAEVLALARSEGKEAAGWVVPVRLTIHGKTIERRLPATFRVADGVLSAEIVGELRFEEFGIEPYSTMLGAIRNDDRFHLYVSVVARPAH